MGLLAGCVSKVDGQSGRKYPCERSGSAEACPAGWSCGLEGYCKNPNEALPYLCASDLDCVSTTGTDYHCGFPNGFNNPMRCYDRAAAGAIACRRDAGATDCAPGWRCGLEDVCHALDAGGAYACQSDSDCEAGYRCSQGTCVDGSGDALRPTDAGLAFVPVRPGYSVGAVFAVGGGAGAFAWVESDTLHEVTVNSAGGALPDGGMTFVQAFSAPLDAGASALVLGRSSGMVVLADARGVFDERGPLVGDQPEAPLVPGLPNARLALTSTDRVLAFTFDRYAEAEPGGPWLLPARVPAADAGNVIRDLLNVQVTSADVVHVLATSRGLYGAHESMHAFFQADGGTSPTPQWQPLVGVGFGHRDCGAAGSPVYGRLRPTVNFANSSGVFSLGVELVDAGAAPRVAVLARDAGSFSLSRCEDVGAIVMSCPACPAGADLVDFLPKFAAGNVTNFTLYSTCASGEADGGLHLANWFAHGTGDGGCSLEADPLGAQVSVEAPLRPGAVTAGAATFVDGAGRWFDCQYGGGCGHVALVSPPMLSIGQLATGAWAGLIARAGPQVGLVARDPLLGLTTVDALTRPLGAVGGVSWAVISQRFIGGASTSLALAQWHEPGWNSGDVVAVLADSSDLQADGLVVGLPGYQAFGTFLPDAFDGGTAVVAVKDRIWAGRLSLDAPSGPERASRALGVRAVPLPFATIQALVVNRDDPTVPGALLSGYVLVQGRVFRLIAHNEQLYDTQPVQLPPGEVVGLWADAYRGRAAFRSGEVYSLPNGVRISAPLPEAPVPDAVSFASACGRGFALGHAGVYQLTARSGTPLGVWEQVDLSSLGLGPADFSAGRLFEGPGEVALFTSSGSAFVAVAACPEGAP